MQSESASNFDDGLLKPTRRATSPSPRSKSPSFSLFPSTPSSRNRTPSPQQLHKRVPLQRSATVPLASSPARSTFELSHSTNKDQSAVIVMVHSPTYSPDTPISSYKAKWSSDWSPTSTEASAPEEQASDQTRRDEALYDLKLSDPLPIKNENAPPTFKLSPPPVKKRQTPERIGLTDANDPSAGSQNLPRHVSDLTFSTYPSWTTREESAIPQTSTSNIDQGKAVTSRKVSNVTTARPLTSSPPSAGEISIARQISLSRRQRQMVVPIMPKTARQPMQATLVDVVGNEKVEGERKGHASRKSHHVLLEDA